MSACPVCGRERPDDEAATWPWNGEPDPRNEDSERVIAAFGQMKMLCRQTHRDS